jgi:hypothetical protein
MPQSESCLPPAMPIKPMLMKLLACCMLVGAVAGAAAATQFTFAALGDAPYTPEEETQFVAMMGDLNREPLAFAVHVGDFKSGHSFCSDAVFLQRREWFALSHHPFIFVPGDNDWSDCGRTLSGGHAPLERLARLRALFFSDDFSLGQRTLRLVRQSGAHGSAVRAYPEHARWTMHGVMFVTLNVPGGGNNLQKMPQEFAARDAAVREWLRLSFAAARAQKLRGVVVMMQANPWAGSPQQRRGYEDLVNELAAEIRNFSGAVALIHGDTHRFRVDSPLLHPASRKPLPNFTRIEVFGSPRVNWVRVRVTEKEGRLRFEATPGN